jgi:squalene-hopene/tetraprenyl-beta-curcumene cyclase
MKNVLILTAVVAVVFLGCEKSQTPPVEEEKSTAVPVVDGKELSSPTPTTEALGEKHAARAAKLLNGGLAYLASAREDDGGWSMDGTMKPAVTALVLKALVQHPDLTVESPIVKKGFEVLLNYQQEDGGIYDSKQGRNNYTTAIAVSAIAAADDPKFKEPLARAVKYLLGLQIIPGAETPEGQEIDKEHPFVGGVSYGEHGRPDLSNVGFWVQALHDAGVKGDDPAMQRSLMFVTRTQNLSETNPLEYAQKGTDDGGFIYAPAQRDAKTPESKAKIEGLRSYGSMTYVGFKSLLYAGLGKDDPRVKAAYAWIRRYWRLDSNPNMPQAQSLQGLYYYYHVLAKALRAWGEDEIPALGGEAKHNWRQELVDALAERVGGDGAWVNTEPRWGEASPILATCYAALALEEAMKK